MKKRANLYVVLFVLCAVTKTSNNSYARKKGETIQTKEPENKAQSRQWVGPGFRRPKTQPSADKVMATVFWDAKSVIMLAFLPERKTITGVYYANLLDQLRTANREKRRGKLSKCVLLQQDNARVHTCKVAMDAVERNGYELIPHPAYSPGLALSDLFSIPKLEKKISVDVISVLTKKS